MIKRSLKEIQEMCNGNGLKQEYEDLHIEGVSTDSRKIYSDQLFIPLSGENFNGHEFLSKAMENGALAALWNKNEPIDNIDFPFIFVEDTLVALQELAKSYRQQLDVKVIGITGSNGKTSTKDILASLLETQYRTHKTLGNFNNHIGLPLTILNMAEDTEMAVLEMGMSDFGEIQLLTSIAQPDAAVITNVGEAHLEGLKSRENIALAKLEILEGLKPKGLFLYPGDDPMLKEKASDLDSNYEIKSFGLESFNDFQAEIVFVNEKGVSFFFKNIYSPTFFLPMLGKHQVYNASAAIGLARYFDISFDNIEEGLLNVEATGMRNELVEGRGFTILNDSYKSNPSSVLAALDTLYFMKDYDQKIVVLGDMLGLGDAEVKMHEDIGSAIDPKQVDHLFTIGPISRNIAKIARLKLGEDRVSSYDDKSELVANIKEIIKANSLILIKASRAFELEDVVKQLLEDIK